MQATYANESKPVEQEGSPYSDTFPYNVIEYYLL